MAESILFRNANIIDGSGERAFHGSVRVEEDRIQEVIRGEGTPDSQGHTVIDCAGKTLMPGLCDAHSPGMTSRPWMPSASCLPKSI